MACGSVCWAIFSTPSGVMQPSKRQSQRSLSGSMSFRPVTSPSNPSHFLQILKIVRWKKDLKTRPHVKIPYASECDETKCEAVTLLCAQLAGLTLTRNPKRVSRKKEVHSGVNLLNCLLVFYHIECQVVPLPSCCGKIIMAKMKNDHGWETNYVHRDARAHEPVLICRANGDDRCS